jgi:hypothetical protein
MRGYRQRQAAVTAWPTVHPNSYLKHLHLKSCFCNLDAHASNGIDPMMLEPLPTPWPIDGLGGRVGVEDITVDVHVDPRGVRILTAGVGRVFGIQKRCSYWFECIVCVYVYTYIYIHIYVCVIMYTYIYICIYIYMCVCDYMYINIYICMHRYRYIYACVCVSTYIYIYTIHIHTYTHRYIYIYVYYIYLFMFILCTCVYVHHLVDLIDRWAV